MNRALKISLSLVVVFAAALALFLVVDKSGSPDPAVAEQAASDPASIVVRDNSHRLDSVPDGKVTFVEFLDFECEACGSAYPAIEQLRQEYGDRVTFVARYFPIASHFNAERAARAVEASAQQGKFEEMYQRMYETQAEWGEQRTPMDALFRSYAVDLGLDMSAYDADYVATETLDRIKADIVDGIALGVQGTPTFFLNGTKIEPTTYGDLADALDAALG